jgi:OmpA-OmpF porin, OOP family
MRKLVIGMAMASTALATPALARDNAWYVGVEGGPMIVEDVEFDVNDGLDTNEVEFDTGYDFGGFVGYDFGAFRLEAEASYRRADAESFTAGTTGVRTGSFTRPAGTYTAVGYMDSLAFMLNGMLDFGADDGLQGFIGGGVGVARTGINAILTTGSSTIDDSDSGFAWQVLAGVRAPLTDNWDVGLKYRMFNATDVNLTDNQGRTLTDDVRSHSLLGTLTYNFGAPEVVAPPPPPAPQCESGPYIVFFDWDKSDITPEAATVLDSAVSAYANCGTASVMLAGYTDRSGSTQYNLGLAGRRNDSVRGYLTSRGVPDGRISSEAFGEANPRVPTADGVRELQNRRVEITYGPGSGM